MSLHEMQSKRNARYTSVDAPGTDGNAVYVPASTVTLQSSS